MLSEVIARDPEGAALEPVLVEIVASLGTPTGPARAVALSFLDDWRTALATPGLVAHLLDEAVTSEPRQLRSGRHGRQLPG